MNPSNQSKSGTLNSFHLTGREFKCPTNFIPFIPHLPSDLTSTMMRHAETMLPLNSKHASIVGFDHSWNPKAEFDIDEEIDPIHDPSIPSPSSASPWRGVVNLGVLMILLLALLGLFIGYPVVMVFVETPGFALPNLNETGQVVE